MSPDALVRQVVTFGRVLREAGLEVGPGRVSDALHGLDAVDLARRDDVYWTLRQTLVSRVDDLDAFDRAFAAWFLRAPELAPPRTPQTERARGAQAASRDARGDDADPGAKKDERATGWSPDELLRRKDFSELSPDELARLRRLIAELAAARPVRRSRRLRRHPRGATLDLRRMVRASLATGGDPAERAFRSRLETHRKLIVLCDVSGSMEPYSRAILLFVHGLLESGRGVEAFAFGTRLTRLTDELSGADPERALAEASRRVVDWSGGTRIGASLKAFNDLWGRRALSRGAVLVVVSDGWEREDAAVVGREMARLARCAYAVVWVNPLKGHPDYEPLAGGMRAALPYVDRFLPGHNLASLEDLAGVLAGIERRHAA
ncbi:MAG TPA: VWA domain-containing protein [Gaiellaceae bacterium]|nr:VWA domain-containing protein [Gaiellaceae bacterium]